MTRILAIDPGSEQSAWLWYEDHWPKLMGGTVTGAPIHSHGIDSNDDLLESLRDGGLPSGRVVLFDVVVIEQIESYGMVVGREVFQTVHWSGRFTEAAHPTPVVQLPRRSVKLAICGDTRAKDSNIRMALIDRFGGPSARGTKKAPGPLHGIANDVWSALAIAVTYADSQENSR